jgi:hypothetical protein
MRRRFGRPLIKALGDDDEGKHPEAAPSGAKRARGEPSAHQKDSPFEEELEAESFWGPGLGEMDR